MTNLISQIIADKQILILGFGKEGRSTYKFLKKIGGFDKLAIADINPVNDVVDARIHCGENYLDCIDSYDIAFKSPGVALPKKFDEYSCKITSQTELFLQAFNRQVIGITGTKGKSTVSSLMHHVLKSNRIPSLLAGNIGTPVFDIVPDISASTVVVLELSCHQLEICRFSPELSVFLNLYEDHLERYHTLQNYFQVKKNIYLHQHPLDVLYCDKNVMPSQNESVSRTVVIEKNILPFSSLESIADVKLRGSHNLKNCAFVYSIAKSFGITDEQFVASLKTYTPLPHRLEFIGNVNRVDFYDDSISTTAESTINAIESIPNASSILLGGMDRGIDYSSLVDYLSNSKITDIICMYQSGKRIYDMLKNKNIPEINIYYCDNLEQAVKTAKTYAKINSACILSPASASYGDFKNFEERGDKFKEFVLHNLN